MNDASDCICKIHTPLQSKTMAEKTNAVRIFDKLKLSYKFHTYSSTGAISGIEVAAALNKDISEVFKTLVTLGKSGKYFVFVVPVAKELDLKKAAHAVGEKSVEMLKQKFLLETTGYVHGGCSPVGMKKFFKTVFDISAKDVSTVTFSAGKIGYQIETTLDELGKAIDFSLADIIAD